MVSIKQITKELSLGEGPHWDSEQQALYFVGIPDKTINKFVLATGVHTQTTLENSAGFIVPVEGTSDQFVVGVGRKFLVLRWDGADGSPATVVKEIGKVDVGLENNSINDGKADPRGRLFAGTLGPASSQFNFAGELGSLYRVEGTKIVPVDHKISLSNGLAWDLNKKAFYYIDTLEACIRRYDYYVETGNISNMTHFFHFEKHGIKDGLPDGMTIDTDGNLWVAVFKGSCILHIDPRTDTLLQIIEMPVKQVTSVAFGGPNYDILFVTTGNTDGDPAPCGATFMITGLGVRGYPNVSFKLYD